MKRTVRVGDMMRELQNSATAVSVVGENPRPDRLRFNSGDIVDRFIDILGCLFFFVNQLFFVTNRVNEVSVRRL